MAPKLKTEAHQRFRTATFDLTEVSEIREVIRIGTFTLERRRFPGLATALHKHHATKLLGDEDYRRELNGDLFLMWLHLDNLLAAVDDKATQ